MQIISETPGARIHLGLLLRQALKSWSRIAASPVCPVQIVFSHYYFFSKGLELSLSEPVWFHLADAQLIFVECMRKTNRKRVSTSGKGSFRLLRRTDRWCIAM